VPARPNIVLLVADDHRFDAAGALGTPALRTPALDALAARGAALTRTHIEGGWSGAVCVPSRACLLTGTGVFTATRPRTGEAPAEPAAACARWQNSELDPARELLPEALAAAGYRTHGIGKWHNGRAAFARAFGGGSRIFFGGMSDHWNVPLHDFDPDGRYPDGAAVPSARLREAGTPQDLRPDAGFSSTVFADAAVDFLRAAGPGPFFLYVAFTAPHDPRTPPPDAAEPAAGIELPPNWLPEHPFDNGELDVRDERLAAHPRRPDELRRHIADYHGMVRHLDAQVGRILEALRATGLERDTVVAYTADHGLALGQHGLLGKQNLYECSVRVPLLLAGPGLPSDGRRVDGLHHAYDLLPTLCALAGVPAPAGIDGRSLLPLLSGAPGGARPYVHAVYRDVQRMVSDGRWKLIRSHRSARGCGTDRLQLFDLAADPWEMRDLAADGARSGEIARLAAELARWQREVGDPLAPVPVVP
jgi:arylsulfatase A-like enzyme